MIERVFDLFTQTETSLARSEGGLGVGLTIVKTITERHGGSAAARSDGTDQGAEFEIRLPLGSPATPESRPGDGAHPPRRALRVRLVEDNRDTREALRTVLEFDGHQVKEAGDAPLGIRLAAEWAPDVAVVDIGLPGRDGYEVAREIRLRLGRSIRIVALTGYGDPETREATKRAGFDAHVVKPVTGEAVSSLLTSA